MIETLSVCSLNYTKNVFCFFFYLFINTFISFFVPQLKQQFLMRQVLDVNFFVCVCMLLVQQNAFPFHPPLLLLEPFNAPSSLFSPHFHFGNCKYCMKLFHPYTQTVPRENQKAVTQTKIYVNAFIIVPEESLEVSQETDKCFSEFRQSVSSRACDFVQVVHP